MMKAELSFFNTSKAYGLHATPVNWQLKSFERCSLVTLITIMQLLQK